MSRHNDKIIKDVLKEMVGGMKHKSKLHQSKIRTTWEATMGKSINAYTTDINLRGKTLYLNISSSPLKQELAYSKEKIKDLLNKELGEEYIQKVVIR